MSLADFSIRRPIATTTLILVFLVFGIKAYRNLGLDLMPSIEFPFITVVTVYPGASPQEIETDVAKRIEDAVVAIDGLRHVSSSCMENVCQTLIEFQLDRDIDLAAVDVREKIDLIRNEFPEGVEAPEILKFDVNAKPVVTLVLSGELPLDLIYDYADNELRDRFSVLSGVAGVEIAGGAPREVHVVLDRTRLAARGLSAAGVMQSLSQGNRKIPAGTLDEDTREVSVTFDAEARTLEELGELEIGAVAGQRVRLRDVAEIRFDTEKLRTRAYYEGKPCVTLKIIKKGDANAVRVVDHVRGAADEARRQLPGGLRLAWFRDDGDYIRATVNDAWSNIAVGVLLTGAILLLFLLDVRVAFIAFLSMPASIVVTFAGMSWFDYTFNTSTLLAIGISVGVLVTNSIVVLESIVRKLQDGQVPREAARLGASEVLLPVFASALTNVVVFVPIGLMRSLVGRFFVPFAVTVTIATVVSLFVSFTLTPILAAALLRPHAASRPGRLAALARRWEGVYRGLEGAYGASLRFLARLPLVPVLATAAAFVATLLFVAPRLGMDFFPHGDQGELTVKLEYATDTSLTETTRRAQAVAARVARLPDVLDTVVSVGKVQGIIGQASEGAYLAEVSLRLTPKTERSRDLDTMRELVRDALANESNCLVSVLLPSGIGGASKSLEMEIYGGDLRTLDRLGAEALRDMAGSGLSADPENNVRPGKPELRVFPRRAVLHDIGLPPALLGTTLRANLEGITVSTFKVGDRSYDIRVTMAERPGMDQVQEFSVPTPGGRPLALSALTDTTQDTVPVQITRSDQRRVVKLYADPAKGVALGRLVDSTRAALAPRLPAGYGIRFVGVVEKMGEALADFRTATLIALILTYLTLAALLESWTQPLLILSTVPLGYMGVILALFLAGTSMSMMALLANIMLIGIVVNNAILIIDEMNSLRVQDLSPREAMLTAAPRRFRPILMTSLAAILGMWPMAVGTGLGSELRAPCGIASVGGMILSSVLSLYFVPLFYILVRGRRRGHGA